MDNITINNLKKTTINLILIFLLQGCASKVQGWKNEMLPNELTQEEVLVLLDQAEFAWSNREKRDQLQIALTNFEKVFFSTGVLPPQKDRVFLSAHLAQGYYQLGDYHQHVVEKKLRAYKMGGEWAERGLGLNPYFKKAVIEHGHFVPGIKYLDKEYAGVMYWYLANIGKWALYSGVNTSLKYKELLKVMAARLEVVDSTYFHGGVYRVLGAFYAVLPSYAGGDLDQSWNYFQKSLKIAPDYVGTKILLAQAFAVFRNDGQLFKQVLNEVVNRKLDKASVFYPENLLEQRKAKDLLNSYEDFFN